MQVNLLGAQAVVTDTNLLMHLVKETWRPICLIIQNKRWDIGAQ